MDELQALTEHLDYALQAIDGDADLDAVNINWIRVGTEDSPAGRRVDVTLDPSGNVTVNPQAKPH